MIYRSKNYKSPVLFFMSVSSSCTSRLSLAQRPSPTFGSICGCPRRSWPGERRSAPRTRALLLQAPATSPTARWLAVSQAEQRPPPREGRARPCPAGPLSTQTLPTWSPQGPQPRLCLSEVRTFSQLQVLYMTRLPGKTVVGREARHEDLVLLVLTNSLQQSTLVGELQFTRLWVFLFLDWEPLRTALFLVVVLR